MRPLLEPGLVENFVSLGDGLVQERIAGTVGEGRLIWGTIEWARPISARGASGGPRGALYHR